MTPELAYQFFWANTIVECTHSVCELEISQTDLSAASGKRRKIQSMNLEDYETNSMLGTLNEQHLDSVIRFSMHRLIR